MTATRLPSCTMSNLKLVLFDLDGTLTDSYGFLTQIVESAFEHVGVALPPPEVLRQFYTMSFDAFFKQCDAYMSAEQIAAASEYVRTRVRAKREPGTITEPFYKGMRDVLQTLKDDGYLLGIVTNKGGQGLDSVLASNDAAGFFATLQHADNSISKPSPDMILNAIDATGVDPDNCIVVGDGPIDLLAANNARVRFIGVAWAGRDTAALREAGAADVLVDIAQLVPAIKAAL